MPSRDDLTKRVPSLAEWLDDDVRADGFEQWMQGNFGLPEEGLSDDQLLWLRLAQTFGVACVEQMNRETARDPSPKAVARALSMWARVAGFMTITAAASIMRDDAPHRKLARVYAEDFKIGAKMAADTLAVQEAHNAE